MLTVLILLPVALAEPTYGPIGGLDLSARALDQVVRLPDGRSLTYSVYQPRRAAYPTDMIAAAISAASELSVWQVFAITPGARPCSARPLDIFEVTTSALNDPTRFPERFVENRAAGRGPLWGYFDPGAVRDAIVVSDHGSWENRRILEHEIAHRWYAAFCMDRYTSMTSEAFAVVVAGR